MEKWIQKALKKHHKGSLHHQLHIPLGHKIPESELRKIIKTHIGKRAAGIKVTRKLKERAVLAENLRHFKHYKK